MPCQAMRLSFVALRKESVDRNCLGLCTCYIGYVALRKESVDRNLLPLCKELLNLSSLSARRAWIEIATHRTRAQRTPVALRKESVDRNQPVSLQCNPSSVALRKESVDRNSITASRTRSFDSVALRKESVDRNFSVQIFNVSMARRSPQGERG